MMDRPDAHEGLVKVRVRLPGSALESGYEFESLWAEPLGGGATGSGTFRSSPTTSTCATVERAPDPEGGLPIVTRVVEQGDCFTTRLYFVADGIATFESSFQPDEPQVGETGQGRTPA